MKKVLIGTVTLERDVVMYNMQFQYAASFEQLKVEKGEYPIYAYEDDLKHDKDGNITLGWRNYIGFEGTVVSGNVGNNVGDHSSYHQMVYDYELADRFVEGHDYCDKIIRRDYDLLPEWGIEIHDFISSFDSKRKFSLKITKKTNHEFTYMD